MGRSRSRRITPTTWNRDRAGGGSARVRARVLCPQRRLQMGMSGTPVTPWRGAVDARVREWVPQTASPNQKLTIRGHSVGRARERCRRGGSITNAPRERGSSRRTPGLANGASRDSLTMPRTLAWRRRRIGCKPTSARAGYECASERATKPWLASAAYEVEGWW